MTSRPVNAIALLLGSVSSVLLFSGCSSAGPDRTKNVSLSMTGFKDEISKIIPQVDAATTSLTKLASASPSDLRQSFDAYTADVGKIAAQVEVVRSRADAMKARGQEYFAAWKENLMSVKNADIRATNEKREAEANKAFSEISAGMQEAKDAFKPFFSDLQDIQKALANDLTVSGVTALSGVMKKTVDEAGPVKEKIGEVVADVDSLAKAFYTAPPPPSGQPAASTTPGQTPAPAGPK